MFSNMSSFSQPSSKTAHGYKSQNSRRFLTSSSSWNPCQNLRVTKACMTKTYSCCQSVAT